MAKKGAVKVVGVALDIIQIALAVVVIVLTSWKLLDLEVEGINVESTCYLDGGGSDNKFSGTAFCIYAICVGVVSVIANAIFSCLTRIFKCLTLNACGCSKLLSVVTDSALGIWWLVAFVLFVQRGTAANELDWPERASRDGVIAASCGAMVAFFVDAIVSFYGVTLS